MDGPPLALQRGTVTQDNQTAGDYFFQIYHFVIAFVISFNDRLSNLVEMPGQNGDMSSVFFFIFLVSTVLLKIFSPLVRGAMN